MLVYSIKQVVSKIFATDSINFPGRKFIQDLHRVLAQDPGKLLLYLRTCGILQDPVASCRILLQSCRILNVGPYNVPVKLKLKHPPPRAYPGHLTVHCAREGGYLNIALGGWGI